MKAIIFGTDIPILVFPGCTLEERLNFELPSPLMESTHINVKIILQYKSTVICFYFSSSLSYLIETSHINQKSELP